MIVKIFNAPFFFLTFRRFIMQNLFSSKTLDNITRIEYCGEFVLTSAQLAYALTAKDDKGEVTGKLVTVQTISDNFNNNRDRYVEGKHYFRLTGDKLATFRDCVKGLGIVQNVNLHSENFRIQTNDVQNVNNDSKNFRPVQNDDVENFDLVTSKTRTLYLWTKRGCLHHCKSVNTDVAWQVYEYLEDTYFKMLERKEKPLPEEKPPIENPPPLDFIRTCTLIGMATCVRDPECFDKVARDAGYFIANGKFPDSSPQFKSLKEPIKLFYL